MPRLRSACTVGMYCTRFQARSSVSTNKMFGLVPACAGMAVWLADVAVAVAVSAAASSSPLSTTAVLLRGRISIAHNHREAAQLRCLGDGFVDRLRFATYSAAGDLHGNDDG